MDYGAQHLHVAAVHDLSLAGAQLPTQYLADV